MNDPMMRPRPMSQPQQQPVQPMGPQPTPMNESPKAVFPEVPSMPQSDSNSLAPVDSLVSDSNDQMNNANPDQHFIHPDQASVPQHDQQGQHAHHLTPAPISHHSGGGGKKSSMIILLILAIIVGVYLAIDAGVIGKNINLPFHVFKQKNEPKTAVDVNPAAVANKPAASANTAAALPDGFVNYKLAGTELNIPYPSAWGAPTVTPELGYSKRSAGAKADMNYAYVVNFATNKDVQIAITSGQYLPPTRTTATYYDSLQWCVGTVDATKYYKQTLHFTTAAGIDTPSTVTCDQGPLTDVTKINDTTIVQIGAKDAAGAALGDLYTRNLKIVALPVMRVKDTTAKNSDNIKKILDNLTLDTSAQAKQ
jgi:hypothetical protein